MTSPTNDEKLFNCPVLATLKVISGKWKTRILWLLRDRPTHFGALKRALPGVSAKVLTEQLHQLETDGILLKHPDVRDGVAHMIYGYSPYGDSLIPILDQLAQWGLAHGENGPKTPAEKRN